MREPPGLHSRNTGLTPEISYVATSRHVYTFSYRFNQTASSPIDTQTFLISLDPMHILPVYYRYSKRKEFKRGNLLCTTTAIRVLFVRAARCERIRGDCMSHMRLSPQHIAEANIDAVHKRILPAHGNPSEIHPATQQRTHQHN